MPQYWVPTFDDAMEKANAYFYGGYFLEQNGERERALTAYHHAYVEYWIGAMVAGRHTVRETSALQCAWVALKRSYGERSELDYGGCA